MAPRIARPALSRSRASGFDPSIAPRPLIRKDSPTRADVGSVQAAESLIVSTRKAPNLLCLFSGGGRIIFEGPLRRRIGLERARALDRPNKAGRNMLVGTYEARQCAGMTGRDK